MGCQWTKGLFETTSTLLIHEKRKKIPPNVSHRNRLFRPRVKGIREICTARPKIAEEDPKPCFAYPARAYHARGPKQGLTLALLFKKNNLKFPSEQPVLFSKFANFPRLHLTLRAHWKCYFDLTNFATCFDAPKSASLMHPLLSTRMFAPWNLAKSQVHQNKHNHRTSKAKDMPLYVKTSESIPLYLYV